MGIKGPILLPLDLVARLPVRTMGADPGLRGEGGPSEGAPLLPKWVMVITAGASVWCTSFNCSPDLIFFGAQKGSFVSLDSKACLEWLNVFLKHLKRWVITVGRGSESGWTQALCMFWPVLVGVIRTVYNVGGTGPHFSWGIKQLWLHCQPETYTGISWDSVQELL